MENKGKSKGFCLTYLSQPASFFLCFLSAESEVQDTAYEQDHAQEFSGELLADCIKTANESIDLS
ncbi:MAG: hypothetical protein J7K32_02125 [Deltaproteobacteria bacterium]|nr:hypothetical protein [Deltaproteobacteria bacterium]